MSANAKNNETKPVADETVSVPQQAKPDTVHVGTDGEKLVIVVTDEESTVSKLKQIVNKINKNKKPIIAFVLAAAFAGFAVKKVGFSASVTEDDENTITPEDDTSA
jgi:hypothetical protein